MNLGRSKPLLFKAAFFTILTGLISAGHHWYGAVAYNTMWRAAVSYWIIGIVIAFCFFLYIYWNNNGNIVGKISIWIFFLGAAVFQTGFTLFECVYSHVLKNILYFGGIPLSVLESMFPAPAYHLPDNLWFEITGVLQLVGLLAAWYSYHVFLNRPWKHKLL